MNKTVVQQRGTQKVMVEAYAPDMERASNELLSDDRKDHFVTKDGVRFAGTHLLIDLWGASGIDDLAHVQSALTSAASAAGATLLNIDLHCFTPNNGISGVAILAESHISIHTWPEESYAALDVFMCGKAQPMLAVPVFERSFSPSRVVVHAINRGTAPSATKGLDLLEDRDLMVVNRRHVA